MDVQVMICEGGNRGKRGEEDEWGAKTRQYCVGLIRIMGGGVGMWYILGCLMWFVWNFKGEQSVCGTGLVQKGVEEGVFFFAIDLVDSTTSALICKMIKIAILLATNQLMNQNYQENPSTPTITDFPHCLYAFLIWWCHFSYSFITFPSPRGVLISTFCILCVFIHMNHKAPGRKSEIPL